MPKNLTVSVTVIETSEFRLRFWPGKVLMWLAVFIWGCNVEFVNKSEV